MNNLPTNRREQQKWILAETGRQIIAPIVKVVAWLIEAPYKLEQAREVRAKLENLTDETLLDRMSRRPKKLIVRGEQEAEEVPVRILHRPLSLDGILKPAC